LHTCTGTHNSCARVNLFPESSQDLLAICWSHFGGSRRRSCGVLVGLVQGTRMMIPFGVDVEGLEMLDFVFGLDAIALQVWSPSITPTPNNTTVSSAT
jgi:hypothetical protein